METLEIKKISKKNLNFEDMKKAKEILEKKYIISYGEYSAIELKKALNEESPFFIKNNFIIGYNQDGTFANDKKESLKIDKMVKAVILEDVKNKDDDFLNEEKDNDADFFAIISKNEWEIPLIEFNNIISPLRVGVPFLPPHSAVFNFLTPSKEEKEKKIVSCLDGININIYEQDKYIDNCLHEIGHLFWRDSLNYFEKEKFNEFFKYLKPSAIYEYDWERSSAEEVFCTIYKWYLKSFLINKSFFNILNFEEPKGLKMLQDIISRITEEIRVNDVFDIKKDNLYNYLKPKFDITTGKRIIKQGLFEEIKDLEIPEKLLNDIDKFEEGISFIKLNKAIVPISGNKIDWNKFSTKSMQKAKKEKTVFMDMDGVIADFDRQYRELFNRDAKKDDSFTCVQFVQQQPNFFRNIPILPQGLELFNLLKNKYRVIFLTTPMTSIDSCKRDKIEWVKENLGDHDVFFAIDKSQFVEDDNSILIDDRRSNLENWINAGGTSIKFPQSNEKILNIIEETFNPVKTIKIENLIVNENPTKSQKENGNYKKGKINFKGLDIRIENPKGSIRWGFDERGKKWINKMKHHYGYIVGTEGADFDPIDCFLGDKNASRVFVINQGRDGMFDEHKIMLGFDNIEEAQKAYLSNYQKSWDGLMSIVQTNTKILREWLKKGSTTEPFL